MDKVIGLLILALFGGAGLISMFAVIDLMLPALVEQTRAALEVSLGRSLLLGLANFIFAGVAVGLLSLPTHAGGVVAGIFVFLIGLVGLAVIALLLLGLVSVASLLGGRLSAVNSPVASDLRGGALLVLACLTPYLGWFVFTPLVLWTAFGAAIKTTFRRRQSRTVAAS